jgi:hypothetical protein
MNIISKRTSSAFRMVAVGIYSLASRKCCEQGSELPSQRPMTNSGEAKWRYHHFNCIAPAWDVHGIAIVYMASNKGSLHGRVEANH